MLHGSPCRKGNHPDAGPPFRPHIQHQSCMEHVHVFNVFARLGYEKLCMSATLQAHRMLDRDSSSLIHQDSQVHGCS